MAGELTSVWVPDRAHDALRDLVQAPELAKADQFRACHPLAHPGAKVGAPSGGMGQGAAL